MIRKTIFASFLAAALAAPFVSQLQFVAAEASTIVPPPCFCFNFTTARFTRVGATCQRAKNNAVAAASNAAQCSPGDQPCGPTSIFVSHDCFPHPVSGQTAAEAFAEYSCEICIQG